MPNLWGDELADPAVNDWGDPVVPEPTSSAAIDMAKRAARGAVAGVGHVAAAGARLSDAWASILPDWMKDERSSQSEHPLDSAANMAGRVAAQIPVDAARDGELKSALAEGVGSAVPVIAATAINPVAGVVTAAGQMGEAERGASLAAGDASDVAAAKAQLARAGGAAMGLVPGGPVRAAAGVAERIASRGAAGAVIGALQDASLQELVDGTVNWGRVMKAGALGGGFGFAMGIPEALVLRKVATSSGKPDTTPGVIKAALEQTGAEPAVPAGPGVITDATPAGPGPGVPPAEGAKPLGLIQSAQESPEIKPELKAGLAGFYEPKTNTESLAEATRRIDAAGSLDAAKAQVLLTHSPDAVSNAMGLELLRKFQTENRLQDAADVLYDLSLKAKTQGQAIQILSTLSRSTPEGMAVFAQRLFGRKLTEAELEQVAAGMAKVEAAKAPEVKLARQATLMDALNQQAKGAPWDEKASSAMNIAMLLNPKTIIRNIGGNTLMATADLAADVLAPSFDAGVSVFTGKRTVSGPQVVEYFKGLAQPGRDFKAGYEQVRSEGGTRRAAFSEGLQTMAVLAKIVSTDKTELGTVMNSYRTVFSGPVMRGFEKTMGVVMGAPDRAYYTGRLRASLANQMKAAGTAVPSAEMLDQASIEAARAVYQDANFVSNALRQVRTALNYGSTLGKSTRFGAGQAIVPFVQVPGSLLVRGLEYSPAGFLKPLAEAVGPLLPSKRPFNQREFSIGMSKAFAGTAGLAATGYWLGKMGIITGQPDPDARARSVEKAQGFGEYRVNVSALKRAFQSMDWKTPQSPIPGDLIVNYDWAQPMAFPVAMGADYHASHARIEAETSRGRAARTPGQVLGALLSASRTLEEQPMLTGLSGFMSSAAAAQRGDGAGMLEALSGSMMKLPGQYVPAAVRQVTQLIDNRVYETRGTSNMENAYNQVAVNIPGMATAIGLKPKSDVLGDLAERYQANSNSFFNVIVNPVFVSHVKADPELSELSRIWRQTGETKQIPGQVDATISIRRNPNGTAPAERKVLTAPERADYQQFVGRLTRDAFRTLMRADGYQRANDEQRAKVLGRFVSSANVAAKVLLFGDRPKSVDSFDRGMLGMAVKSHPELKPKR